MSSDIQLLILFIIFENIFVNGDQLDNPVLHRKKINSQVEYLVRKWAPLIYLAPNESYRPSSVEDFLKHVYPANGDGLHCNEKAYNQNLFMKTVDDIDLLRNEKDSFLHGSDIQDVPAYALVTNCHNHQHNNKSITKTFFVSYWYFYPYNLGKEICFLGKVPTPSVFSTCFGKKIFMGNHVGDWEHITLSFKNLEHPDSIFVSSHEFGAYYKYNHFLQTFIYESQITKRKLLHNISFPKFLLMKDNHPVLFAAWGSHGFWSEPGNHTYLMVPKLQDRTGFGELWETWKNLKIFHIGINKLPKWISFKGRWGNPRSNCILFKNLGLCKQADGPLGPRSVDFDCS